MTEWQVIGFNMLKNKLDVIVEEPVEESEHKTNKNVSLKRSLNNMEISDNPPPKRRKIQYQRLPTTQTTQRPLTSINAKKIYISCLIFMFIILFTSIGLVINHIEKSEPVVFNNATGLIDQRMISSEFPI